MGKTPSNSPLKGEEGFQEVSGFKRFQEVSEGAVSDNDSDNDSDEQRFWLEASIFCCHHYPETSSPVTQSIGFQPKP